MSIHTVYVHVHVHVHVVKNDKGAVKLSSYSTHLRIVEVLQQLRNNFSVCV